MFLDDLTQLPQIAKNSNFIIIAHQPQPAIVRRNDPTSPTLKAIQKLLPGLKISLFLEPNNKGKIDVDSVRQIDSYLGVKQQQDFYIVVSQAEALNLQAANAFLKNLEEPGDNYHFIFFTATPSILLPTILSRAQIYYLRQPYDFAEPPQAPERIKKLAKDLLSATPAQLPAIAEYYHKQKTETRRPLALSVTAAAIDMAYKSYFLTHSPAFLDKLPKLLKLYESLQKNGHVKLHIVADLI